jgi:hypothetical protein
MNHKLKYLAVAILFVGFSILAQPANAQYGYGTCNRGYGASYGAGYGSFRYGYSAPIGYGYSSYYAGYPGYSSYYAPRIYSGTSLYVSPGYYSAARVVVPAYPVYRPVIVPTPLGPAVRPVPGIGIRIGF